jgi:hypothetical protein
LGGQPIVYRFENRLGLLQYFMIPESHNGYSLLRQKRCAILIVRPRFGRVMLTAIQFDSQLRMMTIEIKHVTTNRMLTAKLGTTKPPISQQRPHKSLRVRVLLSQFTR